MALELKMALAEIASYKRLAYAPWHAFAQFIDNSTQAYFDNKDAVDKALERHGEILRVSIAYDKDVDLLRISDNSIGMSLADLEHALHVALPPKNSSGRSRYGMGLKTAACWLGNIWTIKTKKLGETVEHRAIINVEKIAAGEKVVKHRTIENRSPDKHFTIIEIIDMNRSFNTRTTMRIRDLLGSMYCEDIRSNRLELLWNGMSLGCRHCVPDYRLLRAVDGTVYKKNFTFEVENKEVRGWVGILDKGWLVEEGFSVIHCGRVVRGFPDNWRPPSLYGRLPGSNDLVIQRLVGEIHLDGFEVSYTKDNISWLGDQEDRVEKMLLENCGEYKQIVQERRQGNDDEGRPSEPETNI